MAPRVLLLAKNTTSNSEEVGVFTTLKYKTDDAATTADSSTKCGGCQKNHPRRKAGGSSTSQYYTLFYLLLLAAGVQAGGAAGGTAKFQTSAGGRSSRDRTIVRGGGGSGETVHQFGRRPNLIVVASSSNTTPSSSSSSSLTGTLPSTQPRKMARSSRRTAPECVANAVLASRGGGGTTMNPLLSIWRDLRGGHAGHQHEGGVAGAAADVLAETCTTHHLPLGIPLNGWKIIFQIVLTTLNVVCWYVPLRNEKLRGNKLGLSLANAFSGGVFLSLAFGHLIPECVSSWPAGYDEVLPYMVILSGYLLIFFVEKVAFDAHGLLEGEDHHHHQEEVVKPPPPVAKKNVVNKSSSNGSTSVSSSSSSVAAPVVESEDGGQQGNNNSGRSAVILLGALAVHSILEMASLGLSNNFSDCALLTLSIGLHQPAESIALLVAFLKSGLSVKQIIWYLSVFSAMGPIGVSLGMAVNQFASPIVDSAMLAVVAGTFIYVGATEVIPEEWEDQEHKWKKFGSLLAGIVTIFAITQYTMGLESS